LGNDRNAVAKPHLSPYLTFERADWARLRSSLPVPLDQNEIDALAGLNEPISLAEVEAIYLPLTRLLQLYIDASRTLGQATSAFLGKPPAPVPYVIAIAGSVAVGKSTTARLLRALLARGPSQPRVELVTTDGFLHPNAVLEARGLMRRKGFPESYDVRRLVRFMADVKSGTEELAAPTYSHLTYDILPGADHVFRRPDILLVEGLTLLQRNDGPTEPARVFVSDFFDFSIYVDAAEPQLEAWYIDRFLRLRETAFRDPTSYFRRYAELPIDEARAVAQGLWNEINAVNLRTNIAPTRERARLILEKGPRHAVERVRLRKL
jgi:type I pantothenate kinase